MALTRYELVNTKGLKGVDFKGKFIALDKITDELADELEGKTHILKKKSPAATQKALAAAEASK